jgi:hypothetical protein
MKYLIILSIIFLGCQNAKKNEAEEKNQKIELANSLIKPPCLYTDLYLKGCQLIYESLGLKCLEIDEVTYSEIIWQIELNNKNKNAYIIEFRKNQELYEFKVIKYVLIEEAKNKNLNLKKENFLKIIELPNDSGIFSNDLIILKDSFTVKHNLEKEVENFLTDTFWNTEECSPITKGSFDPEIWNLKARLNGKFHRVIRANVLQTSIVISKIKKIVEICNIKEY